MSKDSQRIHDLEIELAWTQSRLRETESSLTYRLSRVILVLAAPLAPVYRFLKSRGISTPRLIHTVNTRMNQISATLRKTKRGHQFIILTRFYRSRTVGFWAWKGSKTKAKYIALVGYRFIQLFNSKHKFDSEANQAKAGISQTGFQPLEIEAFRSLLSDLKHVKNPKNTNQKLVRVVVDLRSIQSEGLASRGVGKHSLQLFHILEKWAHENRLPLLSLVDPEKPLPVVRDSTPTFIYAPGTSVSGTFFVALSVMTENPIPSLAYLLSPNTYCVAVFYDLIPKHNPGYYLAGRHVDPFYSLNLKTLSFYDEFWPISNSVAHELRRFLGTKFKNQNVYPTGVSAALPNINEHRTSKKRDTALVPTGGDARKNPQLAISALALMEPNKKIRHVTVLGRLTPESRHILTSLAAGTWLEGKIKFLEPSDFNDIASAYQRAIVTLVTSRDEGFSLPVVEALEFGSPVVASNIPPHRELISANQLANPNRPKKFSKLIEKTIQGPHNADSTRLPLLNTQGIVVARLEEHLGMFIDLERDSKENHREIAIISPWSPAQSGVADYSKQTLGKSDHKIFSPEYKVDKRVSRWDWVEIIRSERVFVLGNNHYFHSAAAYALMKLGGQALFHDTRMLDFWSNLHGTATYKYLRNFSEISEKQYMKSRTDIDSAKTLGFEPFRKVVSRAIVHSKNLETHLLKVGYEQVEYLRFSSFKPNSGETISARKHTSSVGVFGAIDVGTKMFDTIVLACIEARKALPDLKLIIVGELLGDSRAFLEKKGLINSSWINIVGRVNEADYLHYLDHVQGSIHIRRKKALSLSGAVIDSLQRGTPVVASSNLIADMELPENSPFCISVSVNPKPVELADAICRLLNLNSQHDDIRRLVEDRGPGKYLEAFNNAVGLNDYKWGRN
jgi:glycosyltransferase involved in cell wall biosynthesis